MKIKILKKRVSSVDNREMRHRSVMFVTKTLVLILVGIIGICSAPTTFSSTIEDNLIRGRFQVTEGFEALGGILAIAQDADGYIWLGGQNGLGRYDGKALALYQHDVTNGGSLSNNIVTSLLLDRQDRLWIGTHQGLNIYDSINDVFSKVSISNPAIESLYEDSSGVIWVGTSDQQVFRHLAEKQEFEAITGLSEGITESGGIYSVLEGVTSGFWFGGTNGLFGYSTSPELNLSKNQEQRNIRAMHFDKEGDLWLGTGRGLVRLNVEGEKLTPIKTLAEPGVTKHFIRAIVEDLEGRIWLASDGGGIAVYDQSSKAWASFDESKGLLNNKIRTLFIDRAGSVWAGHYPNGISLLHPFSMPVTVLNEEGGLSDNDVLAVAEGSDGVLWVGTENGLNQIGSDGQDIRQYLHKRGVNQALPAAPVTALEVISPEKILVGSWMGSLSELDTNRQGFIPLSASFPSLSPQFIFRDSQQGTWVGYNEGLVLIQELYPNTELSITKQLKIKPALSMSETKEGRFWLGSKNRVVLLAKNGDIIQEFGLESGVPEGDIFSVYEDQQRALWLASAGGIAVRHKGEENFHLYDQYEGLISQSASCIVEENERYIWFSGSHGISRFDRTYEKFINLTQIDGLAGSFHKRNTCLKRANGDLVFGSSEGISIFDPKKINTLKSEMALVLSELEVLDTKQVLSIRLVDKDSVVLEHNQSSFSIGFSLLNYRESDLNRFQYKLEGVDEKWQPLSRENQAQYRKVDAGEYVFQLKAVNHNGYWEQAKPLHIVVRSPWWLSTWAYAIYVIALSIILSVIFVLVKRWRIQLTIIRLTQQREAAIQAEKIKEDEKLKQYSEEILKVLDTKKAFLDPSLNLNIFARELGIPERDISSAINKKLDTSFVELINQYRVKEAQRLLIEFKSRSVTDVMLEAGFNSKATFYRAFKNVCGKTPSEYRKTQGVSK